MSEEELRTLDQGIDGREEKGRGVEIPRNSSREEKAKILEALLREAERELPTGTVHEIREMPGGLQKHDHGRRFSFLPNKVAWYWHKGMEEAEQKPLFLNELGYGGIGDGGYLLVGRVRA